MRKVKGKVKKRAKDEEVNKQPGKGERGCPGPMQGYWSQE